MGVKPRGSARWLGACCALAQLALWIPFILPAHAQTETPPPKGASPDSAKDFQDELPEIEARTFTLKAIRKSRSKRVILFDAAIEAFPAVGRILLLKREDEPAIAVRVLKLYPAKEAIAVKRLRVYGTSDPVAPGDSFLAVEKISDLPPPAMTGRDRADLQELEGTENLTEGAAKEATPPATAPVHDPSPPAPNPADHLKDLDAPEEKAPEPPAEPAEEEDDELLGLEIREIPVFDRHKNWLTAQYGAFRSDTRYFKSAGVRYGRTLLSGAIFHSGRIQDSLVLEGGAFFHTINYYREEGDSYFAVPLIATLRYNLMVREGTGIFFYAGPVYQLAYDLAGVPTLEDGAAAAQSLSGLSIGAGLGFIFRVGPNWEARVDAGSDIVGIGLMLRF